MKLHCLGTTGYHPNDARQTACFMLPELGILLDAGTGIYRARDLIETDELHIFLSHVHLDHVIGLTFLFDVLYEKDLKVFVYVDHAKIPAITEHLFHKDLFPVMPEMELVPYSNQPISFGGGVSVATIELPHPGGSRGIRLDLPDRSIAYITDTVADPAADYVDFISGSKTLLHECYFPDGWEERGELTGHSCLTPVAKVAKKAAVEKVYLVHINPLSPDPQWIDVRNVADIFSAMEIAADNQIIDV